MYQYPYFRRNNMTYFVSTNPFAMTRRWQARVQNTEQAHSLPVDIRDDGEKYIVTAYVPGLLAENLNIQILDDALSIEGKYAAQEGEYLVNELPSGTFRRTLRLHTPLDAENANASIDNGILTLSVPRSETARPRSIPVSNK